MRKVKLFVYGKVQGVGFRFLTMMLANELGVLGCVQNCDDGSVYIEAIGTDEIIETFITRIKSSLGPSSKVTKLIVEEVDELANHQKFMIK